MTRKSPIVFLFSGQGSQYYQMGISIFKSHPTFKKWIEYGSQFIYSRLGENLSDIIYRDRPNRFDPPFNRTLFTHPAIFLVEYSIAMVLIEKGIAPDICMGYSIGEYCANAISGRVRFEDCLNMLILQAQLIEKHTPEASMMAILETPDMILRYPGLFESVTIAGINYAKHFVISGKLPLLQNILKVLKTDNIIAQILPISHGFHSSLMDSIETEYKNYCRNITINTSTIPVLSPATKGFVSDTSYTDYFWDVTRQPAFFEETITLLEEKETCTYIDLGPAGTLATFTKYSINNPNTKIYITMNQFGTDLKNIEKILLELSDY